MVYWTETRNYVTRFNFAADFHNSKHYETPRVFNNMNIKVEKFT